MEDFRERLQLTLGRKMVDDIAKQVEETPTRFAELYALTNDEEDKTAWRALWACEILCRKHPSLFINKREEFMQRAMQCPFDGQKRILLNMLHRMPVLEPINVAFLDFCLDAMLSPSESVGVQAVCIKLAYAICLKEPDLMGELRSYLENMEPEYYTVAVRASRNNILKKIRK